MRILFVVALASLLVALPSSAGVILDVTLNTTPLNTTSGYFAFDFLGGAPVQNNTVTITLFSTNSILGSLTPAGAATGTISPGPGTLSDTQFFNEFLQTSTFGTTASFTLDLTTVFTSGNTPDEFAFYLLNSSQFPYATSDPSGSDALFDINLTGPGMTASTFTSSYATASVVPATETPEPGAGSLAVVGIAFFLLLRTGLRSRTHCP
jgi:hypothetical protein